MQGQRNESARFPIGPLNEVIGKCTRAEALLSRQNSRKTLKHKHLRDFTSRKDGLWNGLPDR